ncbi:MAG TPA: hypothetical protein VIM75_21720 [Ohtaekwangia sp.]|uniref:hypothetical protein n=1 Tax=Ohtaekwangia sp. TaxID=2066019 RepID=UPI002F958506
MTFRTIEQVTQEFQIESSDKDEIRKELIKKMAEAHPDRTSGSFATKTQEIQYQRLSLAIEFMDNNQNTTNSLIKIDDLKDLIRLIRDEDGDKPSVIEKYESNLKKTFSLYREKSLSKYKFPKISLTAVTAVATFLWTFPGLIAEHPILSKWIDPTNPYLSIVWLQLIITTGAFWLFTWWKDEREKRFQDLITNEAFQNKLFMDFVSDRKQEFRVEESKEYSFFKEQLIKYILHHYFKRYVDEGVAENLAELILRRALEKNVITRDSRKSMSDIYRVKADDLIYVV